MSGKLIEDLPATIIEAAHLDKVWPAKCLGLGCQLLFGSAKLDSLVLGSK
jgi:hypothetical protein